jgi:predicted amidohydrolase YtcJ
MDAAGSRATGLAVGGGRLLAVGSDEDVLARAGPVAVVEHLDGRVVVPGLVDPHNHLLTTGALLGNVELYDCRSVGEVVERIAAQIAHAAPGEWVVGRGWDESLLVEGRHPTRHDLDPVSPANPVVVHRVWNRLVANSAALDACGISAATPDPPAGPYAGDFERDPGGEPTGLFRDSAKELVLRHVPTLDEEARVAAIERACRAYNAVGLTTIAEPGLYPYEMDAFGRARREGRLTVRTDMLVAGWGWAAAAAWSTGPPLPEDGLEERILALRRDGDPEDDLLRLGGVKLLPDGGIGDRTARVLEPYAGSDWRGQWVVEPERLREHVRFVHEAGWSLDVHTCGDEAQQVTVSAMAEAQEASPKPWLRHRVHHAYLPTPGALRLMARHRIAALVSSPFLAHLGESFVGSLGEERAARMMPMRTYLDAGVPLAGSSDTPITTFDPWHGIRAAVTRRTVAGRVLGDSERLTVDEAISSYTAGAAAALGLEDSRGTLEAGKLADCVVLDRDPWTTPIDELAQVGTVATLLGGRWVHDRR